MLPQTLSLQVSSSVVIQTNNHLTTAHKKTSRFSKHNCLHGNVSDALLLFLHKMRSLKPGTRVTPGRRFTLQAELASIHATEIWKFDLCLIFFWHSTIHSTCGTFRKCPLPKRQLSPATKRGDRLSRCTLCPGDQLVRMH